VTESRPPVADLFTLHVGEPRPPIPLPCALPSYRFALLHRYEEPQYTQLMHQMFFGPTGSLRWQDLGLQDDPSLREFRRSATRGRPSLRLGAFHGEELVGWSYGFADRPDGFTMASSAVLPGHRRVGLYSAMAEALVGLARDAGYHFVHSRHVCTNNPILIAKLRLGFLVTVMEVSPDMGVLLTLEKPLHPLRARTLMARSGMTLMDETMAGLLTEPSPAE